MKNFIFIIIGFVVFCCIGCEPISEKEVSVEEFKTTELCYGVTKTIYEQDDLVEYVFDIEKINYFSMDEILNYRHDHNVLIDMVDNISLEYSDICIYVHIGKEDSEIQKWMERMILSYVAPAMNELTPPQPPTTM